MARTNLTMNSYVMRYVTEFDSIIRGYHIYKDMWAAEIGSILYTKPDDREEARASDRYSIGIYTETTSKTLIGHVPVEFSPLIHHFLSAHPDNQVMVTVIGKRRKEHGLVVPARYRLYSVEKKIDEILNVELSKFKTIEIGHNEKLGSFKTPAFIQL